MVLRQKFVCKSFLCWNERRTCLDICGSVTFKRATKRNLTNLQAGMTLSGFGELLTIKAYFFDEEPDLTGGFVTTLGDFFLGV